MIEICEDAVMRALRVQMTDHAKPHQANMTILENKMIFCGKRLAGGGVAFLAKNDPGSCPLTQRANQAFCT